MQLTVIGLGSITTSMALALKAATDEIEIVGHDPDSLLTARAKRMKAIDKSHWNLPAACEDADLILMDAGLAQMEPTLEAIKQDLKQDVVILAVSSVPSAVAQANKALPETASLVGVYPVAAAFAFPEYLDPSAEWLDSCPVFVAVASSVAPEAVERACTFVSAMGALPKFADLAELDGLVAVGEQLPLVAAMSLASQFQDMPGKRDRLGAAGGQLVLFGAALEARDETTSQAWIANRSALVPVLDAFIEELQAARQRIESGESEALAEMLSRAVDTGHNWATGVTHKETEPSMPRSRGWLRTLFLGGLGRRADDRD